MNIDTHQERGSTLDWLSDELSYDDLVVKHSKIEDWLTYPLKDDSEISSKFEM